MPAAPAAFANSPEALIVGLARTGDRDAFAELVNRKQSWIRNLMRRLSNDPVLADDLAQQTFLQAWRDIPKLREPQKFNGWLKQLAVNTWKQYLRKHDPLRHAEAQSDDQQPLQPHDRSADSISGSHTGLAMDLDRALALLPEQARLCVVLNYHEGMSHSEIAAAIDLPVGTVKSHIRRGTEKLKEMLSAYAHPSAGEAS